MIKNTIYNCITDIKDYFIVKKYKHLLKNLKKFNAGEFGNICYIIGCGPSLRVEDLDSIKNKYFSISSHRIYKIYGKTEWRPNLYIHQDEALYRQAKEIVLLNSKLSQYCAFPEFYVKYDEIRDHHCYYFKLKKNPQKKLKLTNSFEDYICNGSTITYTSIEIARLLGFNEIRLLGIDNTFKVYLNEKNQIVENNSIIEYYDETINNKNINLPRPHLVKKSYEFLKSQSLIYNYRIFNYSKTSKLDIFERPDDYLL
jgi:hypothetical protein